MTLGNAALCWQSVDVVWTLLSPTPYQQDDVRASMRLVSGSRTRAA
jgi:hypothetical protein